MPASDLSRGREAYAKNAWRDAYDSLTRAERSQPLSPGDTELRARAAYMLGHDEEYVALLERAFHAHLEGGDVAEAARETWWIGHSYLFRGERAQARGWLARGQRLLEQAGDCVARGYLAIPSVFEASSRGDYERAQAIAIEIGEIAQRFGDSELAAMALMEHACALLRQGRREDGLRLVDETMVAVSAGELSPLVAGIVYCNTIAFCRDLYELAPAREWTSALTAWCERQPEMLAHQGVCRVHRAELMTLAGLWPAALDEATLAAERFTQGVLNRRVLAEAAYRKGEVHRLRGEVSAAEQAFHEARRQGREPLPGLALLRAAQRKTGAARASLRRALAEAEKWGARAALLPATVDVELAGGNVEDARGAASELADIAREHPSDLMLALGAQSDGAVAVAEGNVEHGLIALRRALHLWQELEAPYDAARVRTLIASACRALGDADTAALELEAAREVFTRLGARPDVAHLDEVAGRGRSERHGLTARELEVLRLVAAGNSNRDVAEALVISERTVARHVQNIFAKLGVSSRAAASVFAAEHGLL